MNTKKKIAMIVAYDQQGGIGKESSIPWRIEDDLPRFKRLTEGCPCIMGNATFASLKGPLANRQNIVLTRSPLHAISTYQHMDLTNVTFVSSIEMALERANALAGERAWVIGGGDVYRQFLDHFDELYATVIHANHQCDVFFPRAFSGTLEDLHIMQEPPMDLIERFKDVQFSGVYHSESTGEITHRYLCIERRKGGDV